MLQSHGWRTAENSAAYLLPLLRPEHTLLDVGSGPGTITADLATRVAHVTATEIGEPQMALTRTTLGERGITNASYVVADIHALPFPDASCDVAHAHQVLQHVADPVAALRELRRVTKPGGIVAVRDADYATFAWYPESAAITDWLRLYRDAARHNGGEPDAGRRLMAWAHAAGFTDFTPSASTWCYATPEDRAWWSDTWATRTTASPLAAQLESEGRATRADLEGIAAGWRAWATDPDAWFLVPHGEILARV